MASVRKRFIVLSAVVVCLGALLVLRWRWGRNGPGDRIGAPSSAQHFGEHGPKEVIAPNAAESSDFAYDPLKNVNLNDREFPEMHAVNYMLRLRRSGFEGMNGIRKSAYQHVAQQSVPEMIASLGHLYYGLGWAQIGSDTIVFVTAITTELVYWRPTMSRDLRVLRLIEEEKSQPDSVRPLLKGAIRDALAGYASVARAVRDARLKEPMGYMGHAVRSSDDGTKYEHPFPEMLRRDYLIRAAFYVLAHGGEMPGELLDAWMALADSDRPPCESDVWLISAYWSLQAGQDDAHSAKHREIVGGKIAVGKKKSVPTWFALTDGSDILVQIKGVDLSGTPCIELLDIPADVHLTQDEIKSVIANFRAHIAHTRSAP